ncbi:MAG: winged helix-turn-helix domain-containing protein [Spirochaetaceae bacterium]|nr:winged helix-turn-helix domain-containing protein [Spirochaetaceae bacterium]
MLKIVFFAETVDIYRDYALNLEDKGINYWTADTYGNLQRLMVQLRPQVLFMDYQMFDHELFDVRSYIQQQEPDLVVLFFNYEVPPKFGMLIKWQDDMSFFYNRQYTDELDDILHFAAGVEPYVEELPPPTKLRTAQNFLKDANKVCGDIQTILPVTNVIDTSSYDISFSSKLFKVKKHYGLGFSEYTLLDFFYKNMNRIITLQQMMELLWKQQSESHLNTLYAYIHELRSFLQKEDTKVQLIRVKKGCYSMIAAETGKGDNAITVS